MSVAIQL